MFNLFRKRTDGPLAAVVGRLANARTHYEVIAQLRESARDVAGADGIAVVRREGDEIVCLTENAVAPLWSGRRFPIDTCISGKALRDGVPFIAHDLAGDPRVPRPHHLPTYIKSVAVYPLGDGPMPMALGVHWHSAQTCDRVALDRIAQLAAAAGKALARIDAEDRCVAA